MKKTRKILAMVCALCLTAVLAVGGTLAYLTSTSDVVTNTFTVGSVTITLDETDVDLYGVQEGQTRVTENSYKLIPGHEYIKDPIVHVAEGSEQCYLFVKVVDQIADIQAATTVADQMEAKGWVALTGAENVYYYNGEQSTAGVVDAREDAVDVTVFESFKVQGEANVAAYNGKTITVVAYAVQADSFDTAAEAWAAAPASWT